jgi:hypothetical protein
MITIYENIRVKKAYKYEPGVQGYRSLCASDKDGLDYEPEGWSWRPIGRDSGDGIDLLICVGKTLGYAQFSDDLVVVFGQPGHREMAKVARKYQNNIDDEQAGLDQLVVLVGQIVPAAIPPLFSLVFRKGKEAGLEEKTREIKSFVRQFLDPCDF